MRLVNLIRKLRSFSIGELCLLLEAVAWLGLMRLAILLLPFGRIAAWIGFSLGEGKFEINSGALTHARRVGWAVKAASGRTPWESACLAQALAGGAMLRLRGIPAGLTLGVGKDPVSAGKIQAHAWLSCGPAILTGAAGRERFTQVANFMTQTRP